MIYYAPDIKYLKNPTKGYLKYAGGRIFAKADVPEGKITTDDKLCHVNRKAYSCMGICGTLKQNCSLKSLEIIGLDERDEDALLAKFSAVSVVKLVLRNYMDIKVI